MLPNGSIVAVPAGGLVGRHGQAAAPLDDPRVSEVHAWVSHRGRGLVMLVVGGNVWVDGRSTREVVLRPDQTIEFLPGLSLHVVDVVLPHTMLALLGLSDEPLPLTTDLATLHASPPALVPGFDPAGAAHIWSTATGYRIALRDQPPDVVEAGQTWSIEGLTVEAVEVPTGAKIRDTDRVDAFADRLTFRIRYESVHVERADGTAFVVTGIPARLLTELAQFDAPTPWNWVAGELWPDCDDLRRLRQRWDRHLQVLRRQLRDERVRTDLCRADQRGNIELTLHPHDRVVDES
jgi:hypothetical protein